MSEADTRRVGDRPLLGRTVAVTRAAEQAGELVAALRALGAAVLEVPTIVVEDPADLGTALAAAVAQLATFDWVVLTSQNGAARFAAAAPSPPWPAVAVVGPATGEALPVEPALVPPQFVAESLVEAFPQGPGRVLLVQARDARPVVANGLRDKGWDVDAVEAYRTRTVELTAAVAARLAAADAVTLTSGSTSAALAGHALPGVVVAIGPVTAEAAARRGIAVSSIAAEHSVRGLVDAVVAALGEGPAGASENPAGGSESPAGGGSP